MSTAVTISGKNNNKMLKRSIDDTPAFEAGDATRIREVLHPKDGAVSLPYSLAYAELEPGTSSVPHILSQRSEVYIFTTGQGRVYVDDQMEPAAAGEVIHIPAGSRQHVENTGSEVLGFWCIVAPPWQAEDEIVLP